MGTSRIGVRCDVSNTSDLTALKLNPRFHSLAKEDSDFDNVRSDPRFKELLSEESPAAE